MSITHIISPSPIDKTHEMSDDENELDRAFRLYDEAMQSGDSNLIIHRRRDLVKLLFELFGN